jgi:hypothetical protein
VIGDPTLSANLGMIAIAFIGAATTYSHLANQYLQLDIDLHDVPDHEYAQSQTFKPRRYIKIDDISDMEAHKMTHFYRDELKRIYRCFGLEDYVLMHGDGIHICVSTASDAHPGRKNRYKFDPEEIFLYTLSRIATGLPSTTIIDMYFGGAYSRWGYGYRFMLDYIDQRYASILGHQGLLRFTDKFPDFHRCIEHYCQRDHIQYDANNNPEIVPGLNHLPPEYNIFGFVDDTIDQICIPYAGPAGDFIGAPRKAQYMTAQRAVYTGYKKLHGIKMETVFLPNGISTIFGPVSARRNDLGVLGMSRLNDWLFAIQQHDQIRYSLLGDGIFNIHGNSLIVSYYRRHFVPLTMAQMRINNALKSARVSIEKNYGHQSVVFRICDSKQSYKLAHK